MHLEQNSISCLSHGCNMQYAQNEALRIATDLYILSCIDHLHAEAEMLKIREHSEILSARHCNTVELVLMADDGKACFCFDIFFSSSSGVLDQS